MDDPALASVGPRLRALRAERDLTLAEVAEATGISTSTLSRLESGSRKPTLELLLPLARTYQVPSTTSSRDPPPATRGCTSSRSQAHGQTILQLSTRAGGVQAFKHVIPRAGPPSRPADARGLRVALRARRPAAGHPRRGRHRAGRRRGRGVRHPHAALVRLRGRPSRWSSSACSAPRASAPTCAPRPGVRRPRCADLAFLALTSRNFVR